jgi:hypothetical protein
VLLPNKRLTQAEKQLLRVFKHLSQHEQGTLQAFAEFLAQRANIDDEPPRVPVERVNIARPAEESVVAAIKRLSSTYPMLDRSILLTETSSLMTAHVMHGKKAEIVIDELEVLFTHHYEEYQQNQL